MKNFLRYAFFVALIYIVFCVGLTVVTIMFPGNKIVDRVVNFGAKPDLLVWISDGNFYQDISIAEQPLVDGSFFNTEPIINPNDGSFEIDEGEYFLFLLNGEDNIPPKALRDLFSISDENVTSALSTNNVSIRTVSSGIRIALLPVYVRSRTIVLVDVSNFPQLYETRCHREIIYGMLTSNPKLPELLKSCSQQ